MLWSLFHTFLAGFLFVVVKDHFHIIKVFKTILFCFHIVVEVKIYLDKNMKTKEAKDQTCWLWKILFQYTQKNTTSITFVLKYY